MKTLATFELIAFLLLAWALVKNSANKYDIEYKSDTTGANLGFPVMWYKFNRRIRFDSMSIAFLALLVAITGILAFIWFPLP